MLISIIDNVIATMDANVSGASEKPLLAFPESSLKQLEALREPMEWIGTVFCNTVRPLLLVQGKWSYQVRVARARCTSDLRFTAVFFVLFCRSRCPGCSSSVSWSNDTVRQRGPPEDQDMSDS